MKDTQYFAPTDVGEAVKLLGEYGEKVSVLAGGTDLVTKINYYELEPDILIYIGGLNLDYIKEEGGKLLIGATTPTAKIADSPLLAEKASALTMAARSSASVAVRMTATIGGNIATASPAADLVIPLLVMDAAVLLKGPGGERVVALKDFFIGPNETVLKPDELIIEVSMPVPTGKTVFIKQGRRKALTVSVVNVAVRVEMDGGMCREARIALGSMAPTPLRCTQAEALLQGKALTPALIAEAAAAAVAATNPIDDQRASAWYRRKVAGPLVVRALSQAAGIQV